MASYFELPPQDNAATAAHVEQIPADERKQLGRINLMSPAVTQLLEHLDDEESDSSSEEGSLSNEESLAEASNKSTRSAGPSRQKGKAQSLGKSSKPSSLSPNRHSSGVSPNKDSVHARAAPTRPAGSGSARQKPTHMARFHSLRSILFQTNIEDKMNSAIGEDTQKEDTAANKWKSQHDDRQMHRPKTPEVETVGKDGIGNRIRTKIRRITSKDVPTMSHIGEDEANAEFDDRASTASSDNASGRNASLKEGGDNASINDSDIEELARWVSRGKSASSRQANANTIIPELYEDSGHESLGQSDVEDLVRWVSRKSTTKEEQDQTSHTGYSDASTESDTEIIENSSDEEEDADGLVRWISHRDGPRSGQIRRNLERNELDSDVEKHYESDVPELGRWFKRHDDTSGESAASSPAHDRAEFLEVEKERGRPRSRASISPEPKQKDHLTDNDVDELVRWVSRKDSKGQGPPVTENDEQATQLQRQEDAKKKQLGMTADEGSLSHNDIEELVNHARMTSLGDTSTLRPTDSGTGSTPILRPHDDEMMEINREEEAKKQKLGMTIDEGSLSHSDVQELIAHVREHDIRGDGVRVA